MRTITGGASYYDLPGKLMANGKKFSSSAMNAAMVEVPLGTTVRVSLISNPTRAISVTVTDRGPYVSGRIIDLTPTAFRALAGSLGQGVVQVSVTVP